MVGKHKEDTAGNHKALFLRSRKSIILTRKKSIRIRKCIRSLKQHWAKVRCPTTVIDFGIIYGFVPSTLPHTSLTICPDHQVTELLLLQLSNFQSKFLFHMLCHSPWTTNFFMFHPLPSKLQSSFLLTNICL